MQKLKLIGLLFLGLSFEIIFGNTHNLNPDITVVFIIDQFAYTYLPKYGANLKYGIKELCKKGIVYHNANFEHAMPFTPTGHAAIATGSPASIHGFCSYGFVNTDNKFVEITDDPAEQSLVYKEDGTCYDYGKSPKYLMTDTVSDKFVLASRSTANPKYHEAVAFSLKPRSSIPLAGNLGKAFWLDESSGTLTTSKFYFDKFPEWLKKFNHKHKIKNNTTLFWRPLYRPNSKAYNYPEAMNYKFTPIKPEKNFCKKIKIDYASSESPFSQFKRSPHASALLFAAAKSYIRKKSEKKLLVYISLSNFDLSGHLLGPDNFDQIDLLYHLDWQIGKMIGFLNNVCRSKKTLFILTADHGISPIPETLNNLGFKNAKRISAIDLVNKINLAIEKDFGYSNIIQSCEPPQLYLDRKLLEKISEVKKSQIYQRIKDLLFLEEGILDVWSEMDFEKNSASTVNQKYRDLFMNQFMKNRCGNIMFLTYPNHMITNFPTGTSHCTPYRYDTHVPLILYQRLKLEKKQIYQPVSLHSLATTQSFLMGILPPSAAALSYLPGIKIA